MSYIGSTPTTQSFIAGTDYFNGTGSQVAFTLSRSVNSVNDIEVIVNNVEQIPSGYSVSGTTLTFSAAPSSGTSNVYVRYLSTTLQSIAPGQGTVGTDQLQNNSVTASKLADGAVGTAQLSATGTPNTSTFLRGDNTWSLVAGFTSGTAMMFVQTAAPTGWTKSTTHDNKALRVVSGTASSGGSSAFSTVFSNQTPTITTSGLSAGATTLSTAQMPSHTHTQRGGGGGGSSNGSFVYEAQILINTSMGETLSAGGGGSHSHTVSGTATSSAITLAVQYVDVIIATKD